MRPPRSTLQPIGQQMAIRAGELPVMVPPIQLADGTDTQPALPSIAVLPHPGVITLPEILS